MNEPVADLELHGARTGNCLRAAIALAETGLRFRPVPVDLRAGQQRGDAHRLLNPDGKVPVLVDRSASPHLVLTQSNAIILHVARLAPETILPIADQRAQAIVMERFFYFVTDVIAPNHATFYLNMIGQGAAGGALLERSIESLLRATRFIDRDPFMGGATFSIADIAALTITLALDDTIDWRQHPALRAWYDRVMARPAVQAGLHSFDRA